MNDDGPLHAWVDESGSDRTRDPGTYILAAAIMRASLEDVTRERMRGLQLRGQAKLHWRDEGDARRHGIIRAIAACEIEHLVVVRHSTAQDRPERQRRKCLERLFFELGNRRVAEVVLESRGPADDRRDVAMFNAMNGQRILTAALRVSHRIGRHEPLLWIPDAVCGAVVGVRTGNDQYQPVLRNRMTVTEI